MIVILDTNIIVADFNMESTMFRNLFDNVAAKKLELRIPQIVKDEVLNKYSQFIQERKIRIENEIDRLNKVSSLGITYPLNGISIKDVVAQYEKDLTKKFDNNGVEIIPYPNIDHQKLAKKEMLAIKPFKHEKGGYRDALIWESIKNLLPEEYSDVGLPNEIVFITANKKDFMLDNKLHPDLLNELIEEELKSETIIVYEKLGEFLEKITYLYTTTEKALEEKLINKELEEFDLQHIISRYLLKNFAGSSYDSLSPYAPYCNDSPYVSTINDDFDVKRVSVKKLNSGSFLIEAHFELEMELEYYIDKADYWSSDDIGASVIDLDWNKHVVAVEGDATVPIQVSIFVSSRMKVESIQVSKVGGEYEY